MHVGDTAAELFLVYMLFLWGCLPTPVPALGLCLPQEPPLWVSGSVKPKAPTWTTTVSPSSDSYVATATHDLFQGRALSAHLIPELLEDGPLGLSRAW